MKKCLKYILVCCISLLIVLQINGELVYGKNQIKYLTTLCNKEFEKKELRYRVSSGNESYLFENNDMRGGGCPIETEVRANYKINESEITGMSDVFIANDKFLKETILPVICKYLLFRQYTIEYQYLGVSYLGKEYKNWVCQLYIIDKATNQKLLIYPCEYTKEYFIFSINNYSE
jgi:hypothetical protein